jgi:hypothetical protein
MNGHQLSENYATEGAVLIDFNAPSPGSHPLKGNFTVMYDGTPVRIDYNSSYKVVSRENIIEKVVYKTEYVDKIVYVDKPVASKPKVNKPTAKPKVIQKTIAPDAKTRKYYTSDKKTSSDIEGTVNGEKGTVTMLKTTLRQAKLSAIRTIDNKQFDVTSFKIKVPGLLTVYVEGNTFTEEAIRTIDKAKNGQNVTLFDIKAVDESGVRVGKVKVVRINIQK